MLLPSDANVQDEIARPLTTLLKAGVDSNFLINICVEKPEFFCLFGRKGKKVMEVLDLLVLRCLNSYENAVKVFSLFPNELLEVDVPGITERLDFLNSYGMESTLLLQSILSCPPLLFLRTAAEMNNVVHVVSSFFSSSQVVTDANTGDSLLIPLKLESQGGVDEILLAIMFFTGFRNAAFFLIRTFIFFNDVLFAIKMTKLIQKAPHLLLQNIDKLEEKYEYIYYGMGIEGQDFHGCVSWIDLPLEDIMTRHEFLKKTGKYTFPDEKRPQLTKDNPSLKTILDTPDHIFATKVAGVTLEEWNIYKQLAEKLRQDADVPFERIKPSLRKAYERRLKKAQVADPYTFDSTTASL
uniref:Ankyrin repeat protein n=1 Tax=Syphacia muris TaxID=451379 RepID=A0A0N5A9P0_9BILA